MVSLNPFPALWRLIRGRKLPKPSDKLLSLQRAERGLVDNYVQSLESSKLKRLFIKKYSRAVWRIFHNADPKVKLEDVGKIFDHAELAEFEGYDQGKVGQGERGPTGTGEDQVNVNEANRSEVENQLSALKGQTTAWQSNLSEQEEEVESLIEAQAPAK